MNDRRLKMLKVPAEMLGKLLTKAADTHMRIVEGIPTSAVFITGHYDARNETVNLIYFDNSFPELETGSEIPELQVVIHRIYEATP